MTRHYISTVSGAEIRQHLIAAGLLVPREQVRDRVGAGQPCLELGKEGREEAARAIRRGPITVRRQW